MGTRALVGVRLKPEEYLTHGVYFGQTGKGKTYALALQLAALSRCPDVSVIWFSVKRDDPDFLRALAMENMLVLECGAAGNNFRLDPFCLLDGVDLARQIESLTGALRVLAMELPTFGFLRPMVAELLTAKRAGQPVSLLTLFERIKAAKPSPMQSALMNRLALILERTDRSTFHAPGPFPFDTLMRTNVMLRIGGLGYYSQLFLVNLLVAKALAWRGAREGRRSADDDGHMVLIVVDEAFLFAGPDHIDHESPLRQLFQLGREWKICGLLVTARTSDLDPVFLVMCGLRMCSNVAGGGNLMAIKNAMGLDDTQAGMLADLPKQCFIFQKRNVPAFPVHIPTIKVERSGWFDVTAWNERVLIGAPGAGAVLYQQDSTGTGEDGSHDTNSDQSATANEGSAKYPEGRKDKDGNGNGKVHVPSSKEDDELENLARVAASAFGGEQSVGMAHDGDVQSEADRMFAKAVEQHPFNTTTEIFQALRGRLSQEDANDSRRRMLARDELTKHVVSTGGKGRISSLVLTLEGVRKYGLKSHSPCGRGSFEHQWMCYRIASSLRSIGKTVSVEHMIGTGDGGAIARIVDLWVPSEGWAFQVAVHNVKEIEAVIDLMSASEVRRISVVCNDRRHKKDLELQFAERKDGTKNVEFRMACEFINGTNSN